MENRIITNPAIDDAATLYSDFGCGNKDIIVLSVEDFSDTLKDATTAVAIETSGIGPDRLKQALNDIKTAFAAIAPNLDLTRADKVLCNIVATEDFHIEEMNHLTDFFKGFNDDTNIIWGVTRKKQEHSDEIIIRVLIAHKYEEKDLQSI